MAFDAHDEFRKLVNHTGDSADRTTIAILVLAEKVEALCQTLAEQNKSGPAGSSSTNT